MTFSPFGTLNVLGAIAQRFQAVLDIFLSLALQFPSMIDGKVKSKLSTQPTKNQILIFYFPRSSRTLSQGQEPLEGNRPLDLIRGRLNGLKISVLRRYLDEG